KGVVPQREEVKVKIPPGVDTGSKVMAEGKGHAGRFGGPSGDLIIGIRVKPHSIFERRGNNLYVDVNIKLTEAVLGAEIEVPTIDGGRIKVKVPAGVQEGDTIRMEGYGMPKLMSDGRGDLFARVHIDIPKLGFVDKLFGDGRRIRQLLEELDKLLPEPERIRSNHS
ncbi:MAG: molecular chaperone DnaJ, partial [Aquificaceae bacterium]|nr:molecular chaperone DnaJ [Aquificaceae bacterium]